MSGQIGINTFSVVLVQLANLLSSFIIPRLILENFGSNVNGLVTSLSQFLNYISLLEGGISTVLISALYKPLSDGNNSKISSIIVAGQSFFRKIACVFGLYVCILACVYPRVIDTQKKFGYVFILTLIMGASLFVQYYFALIWKILLTADNRKYIDSFAQIVVILLNVILTVVILHLYPNIHAAKAVSIIAFAVQPFFYNWYIKKNYHLTLSVQPDHEALRQKWSGFGINLAAFVNWNTDVIVLSLLRPITDVSVYSIYSLVVVGIKNLVVALSAGFTPAIARLYVSHKNKELNVKFKQYELLIFYFTFSTYTCAILLGVPFVKLYTHGITDAIYERPIFDILISIAVAIFCLREPYVNMAYIAEKFKEVTKFAYIEALLNISISVVLVSRWGLCGVAVGTIISMSMRTLFQVDFLKHHILNVSLLCFFDRLVEFSASSLVGFFLVHHFLQLDSISSWHIWILYAFVSASIVFLLNAVVLFGRYRYGMLRRK